MDSNVPQSTHTPKSSKVDFIRAEKVSFEYAGVLEEEKFVIGPLNFEARSGEITFIIGGNGSGKTTLAKLLTGLYDSCSGTIKINGEALTKQELGEYFSVIFSDFYVFEKLYMDEVREQKKVDYLLRRLNLNEKVSIENNKFSTIDLSRGQTKRLAILKCFLEDRPIFMFDECAADQDPEFKQFFYQELLPELKAQNKILIIITHDDRYFNLADRVFKMEMGQMTCLTAFEPQ